MDKENINLEFFKKLIWIDIPEIICFVDIETTGLNPKKDKVIEIGAVKIVKERFLSSGEVDSYQCFVKQNIKIPDEVSELTGIKNEMLEYGVSEVEALSGLRNFIGDAHCFGYNSQFDLKFLNKIEINNDIFKSESKLDFSDVLKLARKYLKNRTSYKLIDLASDFGCELNVSHRAVDDCVKTFYVYLGITQIKLRQDYYSYFENARRLKAVGVDVSVEEMITGEKNMLRDSFLKMSN